MPDRDEFYVGYMPAPPRTKRLVSLLVPGAIVLSGLVAGLVAGAMRDPGGGTWDLGAVTEVRGTIRDPGYPVLVDDAGTPYLLVGETKSGVRSSLGNDQDGAGHDGAEVVVRGNLISRELAGGPVLMLSLTVDPDTLEILTPGEPASTCESTDAEQGLVGEIVDSKCFLGAMKPGNGTTHKACGILCVRGGIPPLLVTPDGAATLLVGPGGSPLPDEFVQMLGEPVAVEGVFLDKVGTLPVVEVRGVSRR
ncbi:MAG: hypothetical protein AAF108_09070 [Planctomycetota bacterium]